jgi:putative RNA 2'-phosphotransferase
MHSPARERFELHDDRIRSRSFQAAVHLSPLNPPPALLYCAVRRRAHPVILKRGLTPNKGPWVILALKEEMALRMGRRRDPDPVLVKVRAREAAHHGIRFLATAGGHLALTESVPPAHLLCPPLPPEAPKPSPRRPPSEPAGSFYLEVDHLFPSKPGPLRDRKAWKRSKPKRKGSKRRGR